MPASIAPFTGFLQRTIYSNVEFSIGDDLDCLTTMVPAGSPMFDDLASWIGICPFADNWLVAIQRLTQHISPDAALFRIDWQDSTPSIFSWYMRFPSPPDDLTFGETMQSARPFRWVGPSPGAIASTVGLPGPRGLGLRVSSNGNIRTAIYYRIAHEFRKQRKSAIEPLLSVCGISLGHCAALVEDLETVSACELSVIGIDQGTHEATVGALKLNYEDVPVALAMRLLHVKGVPKASCDRVQGMAAALRARTLSYLGLKYTERGFAGWRVYFSCEPERAASAGSVKILAGLSVSGKSRLPQY